jgi:hypothetical protein
MTQTPLGDPPTSEGFERLALAKAERLQTLMRLRPGEARYRGALEAFLEADATLQKAIESRFDAR